MRNSQSFMSTEDMKHYMKPQYHSGLANALEQCDLGMREWLYLGKHAVDNFGKSVSLKAFNTVLGGLQACENLTDSEKYETLSSLKSYADKKPGLANRISRRVNDPASSLVFGNQENRENCLTT